MGANHAGAGGATAKYVDLLATPLALGKAIEYVLGLRRTSPRRPCDSAAANSIA